MNKLVRPENKIYPKGHFVRLFDLQITPISKTSMKKFIPPILALVCTMILFSCGKETQSSTQGGGTCKISFTITPEMPIKGTLLGTEYFSTFAAVTPVALLRWSGATGMPLASIESPEFSVTKGQNVVIEGIEVNNYDDQCRTVKIECIVNNKIINSFSKELGY